MAKEGIKGIKVVVGPPPAKKPPKAATKKATPVARAEPLSPGWGEFDPTAAELQEVLKPLGGDLSISATTFNGKIMAAIRHNKVEFANDEHGVSRQQYIPQKGQGVYLNIEGIESNDEY